MNTETEGDGGEKGRWGGDEGGEREDGEEDGGGGDTERYMAIPYQGSLKLAYITPARAGAWTFLP